MIFILATLSYPISHRHYPLRASLLPSIGQSLYPLLFIALRSLQFFSYPLKVKSFFSHSLSFTTAFLSIIAPYAKDTLIAFFCTFIVTIFHVKFLLFCQIMLSLLILLIKQLLLSDPLTTLLSFSVSTSINVFWLIYPSFSIFLTYLNEFLFIDFLFFKVFSKK